MSTTRPSTEFRPFAHARSPRGRTIGLGALMASVLIAGTTLAHEPMSRSDHRHPFTTIAGLNSIVNLASTIAVNQDANPYGLAMAPAVFSGTFPPGGKPSVLQPGDLLISDFSDKTGANTGTSILLYRPSTGKIMPYYTEHIGAGPVAIAISSLGTAWIANYLPNYMNNADGATSGDGNVVVITPNGTDFPNHWGVIDNSSGASFSPASSMFAGPWGQAFAVKSGTTTPYFFVTEVDNGTGWVQREEFTPPKFDDEKVVTLGALPVGSNAFDPTGPQGMVYDPKRDILYVASTASNSIVAFPDATTSGPWMSTPIVVYRGAPLNAPLGLTMNPINGDLITVNQLDNDMVEIAPRPDAGSGTWDFDARPVGVKRVDKTKVDAAAGTGSALFGLVASKDSGGNLQVYFVDANTNSLDLLHHRDGDDGHHDQGADAQDGR